MTIFPYINKTILVFGGSGFIGSHLADELIKCNPKKLIIFDNLSASSTDNIKHLLSDERVEFIKGDVRDYDVVEKYVLESDFVFNLSAGNVGNSVLRPRVDLETNIIGTFNILMAVRKKPEVRIVHASSGSVANPSTPYAISKLAGEQYCQLFAKEFGVKVSILRYYHVFGPRQDLNGKCGVINIFLSRILKGLPPILWGSGDAIKCFTFVLDSVRATLMLAEDDDTIGNIYDIASDTRVDIKYLANLLIKKYANNKKMEPIYAEPKIGENLALFPNKSNMKFLGWKTEYTFEQGLDITKDWVEKQLNNL